MAAAVSMTGPAQVQRPNINFVVLGCITALNSGVPAVNTNYDFRALEMCQYLNIPHISQFPGFAITEGWLEILANCYELSAREYDEGLNKFNAYCEDIKTATKH